MECVVSQVKIKQGTGNIRGAWKLFFNFII